MSATGVLLLSSEVTQYILIQIMRRQINEIDKIGEHIKQVSHDSY